jgi:hypothetical protein
VHLNVQLSVEERFTLSVTILPIMLSHSPAGVTSISSFMVGESRDRDMIVTMRRKRGYVMLGRLNFSS